MTSSLRLLKQLFVVTLLFVCGIGGAVDIDDFFSINPTVQQDAIDRLNEVDGGSLMDLHKRVISSTFMGRSKVIAALLKRKSPSRSDLVYRLLKAGAPSEVIPELIEAVSGTLGVARYNEALIERVKTESPEQASVAAYSLSLIARAKHMREGVQELYRLLPTSEIPQTNLLAILRNMFHWEVIPYEELLEPMLRHLCRTESPREIRLEAAVAWLRHFPQHDGVRDILLVAVDSANMESSQMTSIAKALAATPSLSMTDLELLAKIQENPKSPYELGPVLAWRHLRARRLVGQTDYSDPKWTSIFRLLDDSDLDDEAATTLVSDLVSHLNQNPSRLSAVGGADRLVKSVRGKMLLGQVIERTSSGLCAADISEPVSSALPAKFLQAILL